MNNNRFNEIIRLCKSHKLIAEISKDELVEVIIQLDEIASELSQPEVHPYEE